MLWAFLTKASSPLPSSALIESTHRYRGIVPPLVTPLAQRDTLDVAGLERLLEHVIDGGVHGVFILGTTGEAPSLSYRLRRELIDRTVGLVRGRIPVLVGVTDTAFVETVSLAQHAADAGADALVLTTPYYFPAGQTELTDYVQQLMPQLPLPVMIYNMPQMTKVWFEIETLRQLSDLEGIVGIKDSSGDLNYFRDVCELKSERPDWSVLIGPEAKLGEAMAAGGDGGVAGGANAIPKVFVQCYEALVAGDVETANQRLTLIEAFGAIYDIGKYASRHIKATKSALSILGICEDLPADPFHRFLPPEREQVSQILQSIGVTQ